jgi:hypothetical protein
MHTRYSIRKSIFNAQEFSNVLEFFRLHWREFSFMLCAKSTNRRFYAMDGFCHLRKGFALKLTAPLPALTSVIVATVLPAALYERGTAHLVTVPTEHCRPTYTPFPQRGTTKARDFTPCGENSAYTQTNFSIPSKPDTVFRFQEQNEKAVNAMASIVNAFAALCVRSAQNCRFLCHCISCLFLLE